MYEYNNNSIWYEIIDNKIKIKSEIGKKYNITDTCMLCKYVILSQSFQQKECGSRYCKDCYDKMENKYYCILCQEENPANFIHSKKDIFLDMALLKDLEKLEVACPDCEITQKLLDLEQHVIKNCPKGWNHCPTCNEMVKKNPKHVCRGPQRRSTFKQCESCGQEYKIEKHICKMNWNDGCCPFGCNISESLADHRQKAHLFHLDKAWAILANHELTESKKEDSPKFGSIVQSIIDEVKNNLKLNTHDIDPLHNEMKSFNEAIHEEMEIYDSIKTSLKLQIADSLHTSFDGMILWRIDNFEQVQMKAACCDQKSIFSPPFYTSRFGYKMCLRLYPNGDSTAWGVAMSLFLVLMKGNYDSLLTWPFKQKVTFILLDQEFKTNMIDAFVPPDNLSSFSRPRTDMNIPSGSSYFIKFDDMSQRKYVKDNTIFIRCIIDCSDLHE